MPIRKGEEWGDLGRAPRDLVVLTSDAALRSLVERCRRNGDPIPTVGLVGGDLMRSVGGTGDRRRFDGEVARLPIDAIRIEAEGHDAAWFVAHAEMRRSWLRGEVALAMNGQFLGEWDVAPRCHPGDGRVDVVRVAPTMTVRDRLVARRRLPQGAHVPHPAISIRQCSSTTIEFARPVDVVLDGVHWARAATVTLTVEPDAIVVCV